MAERGERLRAILAGLVDGRAHWGAAVVTRDGMTVASVMARPASDDSFAAMSAAMLGAAEGAMQEWADDRPLRLVAEGDAVRIHVQGLDANFFLAVAAPASANPGHMAPVEIDAAASRLRTLLQRPTILAQA